MKKLLNFFKSFGTHSQLEYYVRARDPKMHSDIDKIVRDYFSIRSL